MTEKILLLLGTSKGAFILTSDAARENWSLKGPFCDAISLNHVKGDSKTGAIYAAGGNPWFGIDIWKTTDQGESWSKSAEGLAYPDGTEIDSVWSLGMSGGKVYAGVKPAGLFESVDGGESWSHMAALTDHPTRPDWPPGGAGLTLHHVVTDPDDPQKLWVGISSAGTFFSGDGGASWVPRNKGVPIFDFETGEETGAEIGTCVHGLALGPGGRMYQQGHFGMYVSDDHGAEWQRVEGGLPSTFGFPAAAHPRDPDTGWFVPMNGDMAGRYMPEARAAVWRTRDGGQSWHDLRDGLPQEHCYVTVLRQALAVDTEDSVGVYFGTNSGALYASVDEGDHWRCLARDLPCIYSVETLSLG